MGGFFVIIINLSKCIFLLDKSIFSCLNACSDTILFRTSIIWRCISSPPVSKSGILGLAQKNQDFHSVFKYTVHPAEKDGNPLRRFPLFSFQPKWPKNAVRTILTIVSFQAPLSVAFSEGWIVPFELLTEYSCFSLQMMSGLYHYSSSISTRFFVQMVNGPELFGIWNPLKVNSVTRVRKNKQTNKENWKTMKGAGIWNPEIGPRNTECRNLESRTSEDYVASVKY